VTAPELSRVVRLSDVGSAPRPERIEARPAERAALVDRFGLAALDRLEADMSVRREAVGVRVQGRVRAAGAQVCVVSAEPVPFDIDEPVDLLFAQHASPARPDEEVELSETDLDVLPLEGEAIDLGEAAAQSFGLALDPYPRCSEEVLADARKRLLTEEQAEAQAAADKAARNPFRVLKGGADE
jgi:uncharacterized metal-binding protein YceD (DUF177 family)